MLDKSFLPIEYFYGGETFLIGNTIQEDYYPAICRAQGLLETVTFQSTYTDEHGNLLPPIKGTYHREAGLSISQKMLRLVFQPKTYFFSHTIELVRQIYLLGTGSALGYTGGTRFKFPPKTGGLIVHNVSSGHLFSDFDAAGQRHDHVVECTYTAPSMVNRRFLGNGMQEYCGWNTEVFFPNNPNIYNDAASINPQGSIIENIFFDGTNSDYSQTINDRTYLLDIYPDFKLIVGNSDSSIDDRSGNTVLNNPYEALAAWTHQDYLNSKVGLPYESSFITSKAYHGILLLTVAEVRSCTIANFAGHGIYIFGNNFQNNDFCELNRVHIYANNGNGVHICGGDAGLVTAINLSSTSNAGWGIVHCGQSSTNTFISNQSSYNQKGGFLAPNGVYIPTTNVQEPDLRTLSDRNNGVLEPTSITMPQESFSGSGLVDVKGQLNGIANAFHVSTAMYIGCYSESNWIIPNAVKNISGDNFINATSVLLGCTMGYLIDGHALNFHTFDDGSVINEGAFTGLGKRATEIGNKPQSYVAATLGSTVYKDVAMSFTNRYENTPDRDLYYSNSTQLLFQYDEKDYWAFRAANDSYHSPLSLSHYHNTDIGNGQIWLEKGLFLGFSADPYSLKDLNKRIRILTSTPDDLQKTIASYGLTETEAKPNKGDYKMYRWEEGDIILNKKPSVGGNVGWICCRDTSSGQLKWYPYGIVANNVVSTNTLTYQLIRKTLNNVPDVAGSWQHEGGKIIQANVEIGHYISQKRVTTGGTDALNTAAVNLTLFFNRNTATAPDNITLQGAHTFNSGNQCGSVSAASSAFAKYIGKNFKRINDILTIG